jgi:hypothetical protein
VTRKPPAGLDGLGALVLILFVAVASSLLRFQVDTLHEECERRGDQLAQFEVLLASGVPLGAAADTACGMLDGLFPGERLVGSETRGLLHLELRSQTDPGSRP